MSSHRRPPSQEPDQTGVPVPPPRVPPAQGIHEQRDDCRPRRRSAQLWGTRTTLRDKTETSSRQEPSLAVIRRDRPRVIQSAATRAPWRPRRAGLLRKSPDQRVLRSLGALASGIPPRQHEHRATRLPTLRGRRPRPAPATRRGGSLVSEQLMNLATCFRNVAIFVEPPFRSTGKGHLPMGWDPWAGAGEELRRTRAVFGCPRPPPPFLHHHRAATARPPLSSHLLTVATPTPTATPPAFPLALLEGMSTHQQLPFPCRCATAAG